MLFTEKKAVQTLDKQESAQKHGCRRSGMAVWINATSPSVIVRISNRALQRLLTQRDITGSYHLDDAAATRINNERSGGQLMGGTLQDQLELALGIDSSTVRLHTSPEADALNRQLNAKAFTTGQDIFFREGEYQPHTTEGQQLIAHELTHVVQQASGAVGGGSGKMTVNPPDDQYEREADAVAKEVVSSLNGPQVQRQVPEEDEEQLQAKAIQRQTAPEEEEEEILQRQVLEEDEEELNA